MRSPRRCSSDRRNRLHLACITVGLLTFATPLFGQDASIIGQVTDDSGAVLPGVAVTARGPALQVPELTTVSSGRGEYRLAPLPIGTYEIEYSLAGFQTVKKANVRLTVGFVAKLDVVMMLGSLSESVTVSGNSPVIDVTSTATTTQLTRETLELIPSTRNGLNSLLAQAPGLRGILDVGGSNFSNVPQFYAYGQFGEQWTTLEGVPTQDTYKQSLEFTASGNYFDYTSYDETRVTTVGKDVTVGTRGIVIQAIVKSGSNDFHGTAFYSGSSPSLQSDNIDSALRAQGLTTRAASRQWDYNGELGGRIIRDKLWFYGSGRRRFLGQDIPGVFQSPGGQPAVWSQQQNFGTGKVSFQMSPENRLVGFGARGLKEEEGLGVNLFVPWDSRQRSYVPTTTKKIEWQGVRKNLMVSAQYGFWNYSADYYPKGPGGVSTMDLITLKVTGNNLSKSRYYDTRHQASVSALWYKTGAFGNHSVKVGFDYLPQGYNYGTKTSANGEYQLIYNNGLPFQIKIFNSPVFSQNRDSYGDIYGADSWTIGRRLTLDLGVRYAHDRGYIPAQCRDQGAFVPVIAPARCIDEIGFVPWNNVAPRLSAAYDLTRGAHMTVLKAGWGRFHFPRDVSIVSNANPLSPITYTYRWHPAPGVNDYVPGTAQVNVDPNGPDFLSAVGSSISVAVPNPNEPVPTEDQYFASFERELVSNVSFRATAILTHTMNVPLALTVNRAFSNYNIPITNPDPGPDGRAGTADDPGTFITYYDFPASYAGYRFESTTMGSAPGTDHRNKSVEFAVTKRLSRGWQFMGAYSGTKKHLPIGQYSAYTPNALIFVADDTWEWIARFSGAYLFPYGVTFSANFENRSGTPGARQVRFTGGTQIPSILLNVEPIGSLNLPAQHSLDLRAEKSFSIVKSHKVIVRLNMYNALNANTIIQWTRLSGPNFKRPTGVFPPRVVELGGSYSF